MYRFCLLIIVFFLFLASPGLAQAPAAPTPFEPRPPILQFMLAGGGLALILAILCMPTRKNPH